MNADLAVTKVEIKIEPFVNEGMEAALLETPVTPLLPVKVEPDLISKRIVIKPVAITCLQKSKPVKIQSGQKLQCLTKGVKTYGILKPSALCSLTQTPQIISVKSKPNYKTLKLQQSPEENIEHPPFSIEPFYLTANEKRSGHFSVGEKKMVINIFKYVIKKWRVLECFSKIDCIMQASEMSGIGVKGVMNILNEYKRIMRSPELEDFSKPKKPGPKKSLIEKIDKTTFLALEKKWREVHKICGSKSVTVNQLHKAVKEDKDLPSYSKPTLRKIIKSLQLHCVPKPVQEEKMVTSFPSDTPEPEDDHWDSLDKHINRLSLGPFDLF